jgi:hypothetical protein
MTSNQISQYKHDLYFITYQLLKQKEKKKNMRVHNKQIFVISTLLTTLEIFGFFPSDQAADLDRVSDRATCPLAG